MTTATAPTNDDPKHQNRWREAVEQLGPRFAERVAHHDDEGSFVAENYAESKAFGVMSAGVPVELGGGGATHGELAELLRGLAHHCPATALTLSMHTHLVAATVWKWKHKGVGEPLLRRVATEELVLVSTGATDWVNSNGRAERVEGGFEVTARKVFASGSEAADLLVTSAAYDDPNEGPSVLHFPVALGADGVTVTDDWNAHGMRGTGSNTVLFDRVFVPDAAVALSRPQGVWPTALDVVVTVAMPLIMSVYRGVAESAVAIARQRAARSGGDPDTQSLVGEMENRLFTTQTMVDAMVNEAADYDFAPSTDRANRVLMAKTVAVGTAIGTVEKAMEVAGGGGFYRAAGLERLLRDVRAAHYHPLPERRQLRFTGRLALGLDPVD